MPKIKRNCELMKDAILVVVGGFLGILGSVITTHMNDSHEEKMQNSKMLFPL
ncbi:MULTISPECIES: hypothetical protein [Legionella]|uniref:hypothetical protein n=1 Tax=Legionella TaxID=445 RepID=UPI001ACE274B|nr:MULTISPECIES: hypothetical protein [Legionella]MBN9225724.1 hypothetical protein [Legionella steelei]